MNTPPTRQTGEAVAWLLHDSKGIPGRVTRRSAEAQFWRDEQKHVVQPLIPASDLEQVKQERDEAVRLLGAVITGSLTAFRAARAFLASLEQTKGE